MKVWVVLALVLRIQVVEVLAMIFYNMIFLCPKKLKSAVQMFCSVAHLDMWCPIRISSIKQSSSLAGQTLFYLCVVTGAHIVYSR